MGTGDAGSQEQNIRGTGLLPNPKPSSTRKRIIILEAEQVDPVLAPQKTPGQVFQRLPGASTGCWEKPGTQSGCRGFKWELKIANLPRTPLADVWVGSLPPGGFARVSGQNLAQNSAEPWGSRPCEGLRRAHERGDLAQSWGKARSQEQASGDKLPE